MRPKPSQPQTTELFRPLLDEQLNMRHPLIRLAGLMDWEQIEQHFVACFTSDRGRPALPPRLVAGLLYLQHANGASDEAVVNTWLENPYRQYFCGETYLQTELPLDPSSLTRWRQRIGEEGVEVLIAVTIEAARAAGLINKASMQRIIVDTPVVPNAIAHPTDSRLLDKSRQTPGQGKVQSLLQRTARILTERTKDKNKPYALHAPEVECTSKGKARTPYEFGVKVSVVTTLKERLVVGMRSMPGNPYDGHILAERPEQAGILIGTDKPPGTAIVDKGYKGVEIEGMRILMSGQKQGITKTLKAMIKRRSAIEPPIGHMKMYGRLGCNPLKGALGDALHAVMCGAGHNLRRILAALRLLCARIGLSMQTVIAALIAGSVENQPACA